MTPRGGRTARMSMAGIEKGSLERFLVKRTAAGTAKSNVAIRQRRISSRMLALAPKKAFAPGINGQLAAK
jgi:hypothetical protein